MDRFRVALHNECLNEDVLPDVDGLVCDNSETMPAVCRYQMSYFMVTVLLTRCPGQFGHNFNVSHGYIIRVSEDTARLYIRRLWRVFFHSFDCHILLTSVVIADFYGGHTPPYLELALACLGAATGLLAYSTNDDIMLLKPSCADISTDLFQAGVNL